MLRIIAARHLRPTIDLAMVVLAGILINIHGCDRGSSVWGPQTDVAAELPVERTPATLGEPLLAAEEPLLLLDEEESPTIGSNRLAVDNSRCFVCHANYLDEKIAVTHAQVGIGCVTCHGHSDAHIADESWASGGNGTAPEIMYPAERVNPSCMACHPRDTIDTAEHKPLFAGDARRSLCTDCHGNHRLPIRRSRWK